MVFPPHGTFHYTEHQLKQAIDGAARRCSPNDQANGLAILQHIMKNAVDPQRVRMRTRLSLRCPTTSSLPRVRGLFDLPLSELVLLIASVYNMNRKSLHIDMFFPRARARNIFHACWAYIGRNGGSGLCLRKTITRRNPKQQNQLKQ